MRALELANETRRARARIKRMITARDLSPAQVLLAAPRELERMPLRELLGCQPGWGKARTRRYLARHGLSEHKPIGELTERQRALLAAGLAEGGNGRSSMTENGAPGRGRSRDRHI
jgi:hypothetical protein